VNGRFPLTLSLPVSGIFTLSSLGDTPPYPTPSRAPKGALVFVSGAVIGPFPRPMNLIGERLRWRRSWPVPR
jgi:hypothetical protein